MTRAVYPGTFDPVTQGHLDIVRRAATLFDEVIVAVPESSKKSPLFSLEERLALVKADCAGLTNVRRKDLPVSLRTFADVGTSPSWFAAPATLRTMSTKCRWR